MAGAGYKLFTTGDVLTAAQVNTYLQEQTVMAFADSAARTSALSAVLAEGMMSYLKDTDSVEVYNGSAWAAVGGSSPLTTKGDLYGYSTLDARIPIGTNNQVLTADSAEALGLKWATAGGSMTELATGTLSGSSVVISGISGSYKNLQVIITGYKATADSSNLQLRINNDSTANRHYYLNFNVFGTAPTWNATFINGLTDGSNSGSDQSLVVIDIPNYANATTWKIVEFYSISSRDHLAAGESKKTGGSGAYNQTDAVTGLTFLCDSSTFTGGTYFVYGVN